jgi:hypothetical protein
MALFGQNFTQNSPDMKYLYQHGKLSMALLLAFTFLLIYLTDHYVLTVGFYQSNGDALSGIPEQDSNVYDALQKWVYFSSAAYLLLKLGLITLIIHTALYLQNEDVQFISIFKIVTLAEFIFLIPAALKLLSFNYTFEHATLLDWHRYYVLSALSLFNDVPADWYYALQSLNLFEVAYWFLLALGISRITNLSFDNALKTIVLSYVPALLIWVVSVTFCTLLMFPSTG